MPEQFVVPQFIDTEDKIIGPISVRQFGILMLAFFMVFIFYKLLPFVWFLVVSIPFMIAVAIIAFVKVNGQPFHYFILNVIQTFKRPSLRVWDKELSTSVLKELIKKKEEPPPPPPTRKAPVSASKLQDMILTVNTGGVYTPDEE